MVLWVRCDVDIFKLTESAQSINREVYPSTRKSVCSMQRMPSGIFSKVSTIYCKWVVCHRCLRDKRQLTKLYFTERECLPNKYIIERHLDRITSTYTRNNTINHAHQKVSCDNKGNCLLPTVTRNRLDNQNYRPCILDVRVSDHRDWLKVNWFP